MKRLLLLLLLVPLIAWAIEFTATGSGYYRVFVDGVQISQHTTEREALEKATNVEQANPAATVYIDHDYTVRVEEAATTPPPETPPPPPPPPPPVTGVLFQDDFESYNVGSPSGMGVNANGAGWGGQNQASTFYGVITDQQCHSGSRCFAFQYGASSDEWQQLGFTLPNIGEVWIQYWLRPANIKHSSSSPVNNKAIRLWNDNGYGDVAYLKMGGSFSNPKNGDDALLCEARKGSSDMAVRCQQGSNGIGQSVLPGQPYIARDRWTRVTFHFKAPTPADNDGIMDWWYDGKKAATNHGVPGYPSKGQPVFSYGYIMGWANTAWTDSGTAVFKLDDVIFDTKPDAMLPLEGL